MAHIVVLGGGIGGVSCAYELKQTARKEDRITLVSNKPFFQFTPSNPWVAVKWRTKNDIIVDLGTVLSKHGIAFSAAGAARVHPDDNRVALSDSSSLVYDYLVVATGPELAFDEIEGFGPEHNTSSVCDVDHAAHANSRWEEFCKNPGPIAVGTVQGASCYGPAYGFAMIMGTDLRKRCIRDKVSMTFVTPEPYIGHLGVGDTKGLLESEMRNRHIKWLSNTKVDKVAPDKVLATEVDEDGKPKKAHELPFKFSMMIPAFRGIPALRGVEELANPRGFVIVDKCQRNPKYPNVFQRRRVHRHRADRGHAAAGGRAEDRLHDRIHLQVKRKVRTATSTPGNPNAGRGPIWPFRRHARSPAPPRQLHIPTTQAFDEDDDE